MKKISESKVNNLLLYFKLQNNLRFKGIYDTEIRNLIIKHNGNMGKVRYEILERHLS